ncbi:MAG: alpha/beta fold hydrolase [Anaerolineaceae bacterium]|nr:MAG: alpha/beta fold hydrolase [Anaerolineaceae bacterium]
MSKATINGIDMYYELHGPEGAPVLVLNNGLIMNATSSWVFQTPTLSRSYLLLQYDLRGQGHSEHPPGPYTMEMHADDLSALLAFLAVEKAHIAGISYGGEVAQAFVLKYPEMTRSLILADTVSEVSPALRIVVESWRDAAREGDPQLFFDVTVPWNFSPRFIGENPQVMEDAKPRYAQLDFPALVRLCDCFLEVDFTERLGEIQAPTCIIVGEDDLIKGRNYAEILQWGIPHAEMHVLPGSGHATCWERAEEFNTVVLGFLAKQEV